jgi:hypothetical protein
MVNRRYLALAMLTVVALAGSAEHPANAGPVVHTVGSVTRHSAKFVGQEVAMRGYLLARADGYILFSDEPGGRIGRYDLPVTGDGIDQIAPGKRTIIEGTVLDHGLMALNGNPDHLELTQPPRLSSP